MNAAFAGEEEPSSIAKEYWAIVEKLAHVPPESGELVHWIKTNSVGNKSYAHNKAGQVRKRRGGNSVAAGADMVLVWPPDIRRTHRAFVSVLEDGRLSRERLLEAAVRIIYEKIKMGLIDGE